MLKSFLKTTAFEGPIELLLDLVERRKLLVSDLSLAEVTDNFLKIIENYDSLPIPETTQFIYVASLLLLIKSKELLPALDLTIEESENIDELKRRLLTYSLLRDKSNELRKIFGMHIIYDQRESKQINVVFIPGIVSINLVRNTAREIIARIPTVVKLEERSVKKIISLEEAIRDLTERVNHNIKITFSSYKKLDRAEKINVIISFLAMLELVRRETIYAIQQSDFSQIVVENSELKIPMYG
ncbi:MAG TPA: segregation/condensation protein A [Candidatus Paceibacterota bacterium]